MANGVLGWVGLVEEECFEPISKGIGRGSRSNIIGEVISNFRTAIDEIKSKFLTN